MKVGRKSRASSPQLPILSLAAGAITARDRGSEPAALADEVGCQPAGSGGINSRDSVPRQCAGGCQPGGTCAFEPHERSIPGLFQKLCVDQRTQELVAELPFEAPQPLRLRSREPQTRHLHELPLNSLKDVVDTSGFCSHTATRIKACVLNRRSNRYAVRHIRKRPFDKLSWCAVSN